jgi:cytidylate kinase
MIVAIDGPAGAGKSTVARAVADSLGFEYLDTGALYRAVTVAAFDAGIEPNDEASLARLAGGVTTDVGGRLVVRGSDVTDRLRDPEASAAVSVVAAHPQVRAALIPLQRRVASGGDVVVEGRDIGTTVFPEAEIKVFLTADADERARRRARQMGRGDDATYVDRISKSITERDETDSLRAASPLAKADDAVLLDTSGMPFEEVVGKVVEIVRASS